MGKARTSVRFPTVPSATGHDWSGVVPIGVWGTHHSSRWRLTTAFMAQIAHARARARDRRRDLQNLRKPEIAQKRIRRIRQGFERGNRNV